MLELEGTMDTTADAVVVGGGVMGCSILYNLAVRGMTNAVLFETDRLASGSTGLSQGILRMHYSNEVTTRMAWESLKVFQGFEEAVGEPSGYVRAGYVLIAGENDRLALEENVLMQKGLGVATDLVSPKEVMQMAPALAVGDEEVCAFEPESGYADPYSVARGYARAAQAMGARIQLGTPVADVEMQDGRVTAVVTSDGRVSTPVAVAAAGPWSKEFLLKIGVEVPLQTVRHQVISLRRPEDRVPEHPVLGDIVHSLSARPESGNLTLIGVGEGEQAHPDRYDHGVDMATVEDVAAKLASRMPGMSDAVFRGGWSGLFTTTPDWHPILDQVEGVEGLYCAVGFSGHGFKLSPMVGVAMAELILDGRSTTIDISMLDLNRFKDNRLLSSRYGMSVLA